MGGRWWKVEGDEQGKCHYKKSRFSVTSRFEHADIGADVHSCQR